MTDRPKRGRVEKLQHTKLTFGDHVICRFCRGKGEKAKKVCDACEGRGFLNVKE